MPDDDDSTRPAEASPDQAEAPSPEAGPIEAGDDGQQRLWLRTIAPLLALARGEETGRVQFAVDQLKIAACERATRILRGDLE